MSKRWYVVHAYSGFEKNVARALQERVELSNLQDCFGEILVPTEEVVEMRGGQKRRSERKFFPGYVLVEMELNDDSWHLVKETRTSLDTLLNPFRDQLQDFRKRVEDVYTSETRDRQALRSEIKSLQDLNKQITEEAASLTRALKGDKKVQGNWGELILERVLERSGLRKGVEYETQGSYRDEDNQLLRPDVIVHLPDQRNLVIDSKVSLVAYQQWVTADQEEERAAALKQHVEAVRNHIRTLSEKDYSQLNQNFFNK